MNIWAPTVRYSNGGTGQMTNDVNTISSAFGSFTAGSNAANCAAHGIPGDRYVNAYGECDVLTMAGASDKAGFLFRFVDSSNFYAAYVSAAGVVAVDSVVAGSTTSLLSTAVTLPTFSGAFNLTFTFRAEIIDDAIGVYWRGQFIGSVRDTSFTAAGFTSLYLRSTTASLNVQVIRFETGPLNQTYSAAVNANQAGLSLIRSSRFR